jgi:2-dehydro-3-deoxygalactonokinase
MRRYESRLDVATGFCIAVDWGTSSLRVWLLGANGAVLGISRSGEGADGLSGAAFEDCLNRHIAGLGDAAQDLPVVMCGMVGARNGWREAPYLSIPVQLAALPQHAMRVPETKLDIRILPGLVRRDAQAPDVMRGEETQLLGFVTAHPQFSGLVCLPGTHCKWVRVRQGAVEDFHSAMTGEVYQLLARHSVLRHAVSADTLIDPASPEFTQAASAGLARPEALLHAIFSVRAAVLVGGLSPEGAAARLSGLLIGADVGAALREVPPGTPVQLVASGPLSALYSRALALAGVVDAGLLDAEALAQSGLFQAACLLHGSSEIAT